MGARAFKSESNRMARLAAALMKFYSNGFSMVDGRPHVVDSNVSINFPDDHLNVFVNKAIIEFI